MGAIPHNDLHDTVSADMTLVKNGSDEVLFKKVFSKEYDGVLNAFQGKPDPDSKLNAALSSTADEVFTDLALTIKQNIHIP